MRLGMLTINALFRKTSLLSLTLPARPPPIHCKKSWRKTPPAWPDVTDSLVRGTENFFDMKIEFIRRVPTMKTEYFDISGILLQLIWRVLTMLTDYFEINGIFLRFSILTGRSFPTIFRQITQNQQLHQRGSNLRPSGLQSVTLPLRHSYMYILSIYYCFVSSFHLRQCYIFLR
jgi:hypothetical protein